MEQPGTLINEAISRPIKNQFIDISAPIHDSMTGWPGLPHVSVQKFQDLHKGDDVNITTFSMPVHSGTHIDAPRHLYKNGNDITLVDFDSVIGLCRVIQIPASAKSVLPEHIENAAIQEGERVLFKTSNSDIDWTSKNFQRDFTFLSTPAAELLANIKVKSVGLDYICIGNRGNHKLVHSILFETGISVIEGLNLAEASPGSYELFCLPLKILGADAAPSRAILRTINQ
jgi:arylformamidase